MDARENPPGADEGGSREWIVVPDSFNRLSGVVVDCAIRVHKGLGPGLLESVYEHCLEAELLELGFRVERQAEIPVHYRNRRLPIGFRADILAFDGTGTGILVELKAVDDIDSVHRAQLLTYLRILNLPIGLLLNFNSVLLRHGIERILNKRWTGGERG